MEDGLVNQLERAAEIMMAPPQLVTADQRQQAEQVFIQFGKTKCPYSVYQQLLGASGVSYVQFQVVSGLKRAVVRDWQQMTPQDADSLRVFLTNYALHSPSLVKYVTEQIVQTIAVIVKCCTLDRNYGVVRQAFIQSTDSLLKSHDQRQRLLGCSHLRALLDEYSSFNRSSALGFSWDHHWRCKKSFEAGDMLWLFLLVVQALQQFSSVLSLAHLSRQDREVLEAFMSIAITALNWNFSTRSYRVIVGVLEGPVILKPNDKWRPTFLNRDLLEIFFKLHCLVVEEDSLSHMSFQCLLQLASLSGGIFRSRDDAVQYLKNFMEGFLNTVRLEAMSNALGVANIISRMVTVFGSTLIAQLPTPLLSAFVDVLTKLACAFVHAAAADENVRDADTFHQEAFDQLLTAWMTLLSDPQSFPKDSFTHQTDSIFSCYLQHHIGPPDGSRSDLSQENDQDSEVHELEEDDQVAFSDQLTGVAALGRACISRSLPLVASVFHSRVSKLGSLLTQESPLGLKDMITLHEDLHWLLLISGFLLCDDGPGETLLIPQEIISFSSAQSVTTDIQKSISFLAASHNLDNNVSFDLDCVDSVIAIVGVVLRLVGLERRFLELNRRDALSPQVSRSSVWFLRRWCRSYLLPDQRLYDSLSGALLAAFAQGTDAGQFLVRILVDKVAFNLSVWTSEESLICDSIELLLVIVESSPRAFVCIGCESLLLMARQLSSDPAGTGMFLPPSGQRLLVKGMVLAGSAAQEQVAKLKFWEQFLIPLRERIITVFSQPQLAQHSHDASVRSEIATLLECVHGLCLGAQPGNCDVLAPVIIPLLSVAVRLLDICQSATEIIEVVLKAFVTAAESFLLYIRETDSVKFYNVSLELMKTYAKCNTGKYTSSSVEEEEMCQDLFLFMQLLTNLIARDFLDFSESEETGLYAEVVVHETTDHTSAVDVVLYGLSIVLPLMNIDMLRFPNLCLQYFKLISFICEVYPEKITDISSELFQYLMGSLQLGMDNFGVDVTKLCLEALSSLADQCYTQHKQMVLEPGLDAATPLPDLPLPNVLKQFLKVLFDSLILHNFDLDLLQPGAEAFFSLVCCHPSYYASLVQELLDVQKDAPSREKLLAVFNALTPPTLELQPELMNKHQFRKNFDTFLHDIRSVVTSK